MTGDPGNPANEDGGPPPGGLDSFQRALAGLGIGFTPHNQAGPDENPDADQFGGGATGTASGPVGSASGHAGGVGEHVLVGNPGATGADNGSRGGPLPNGGDIGPGHGGGEPGDAQSGVIGDDGLSSHSAVHETGPGNETFGPSGSLGAAPPTHTAGDAPADDTQDDDSSSTAVPLFAEPAHASLFHDLHLPDHVAAADDD